MQHGIFGFRNRKAIFGKRPGGCRANFERQNLTFVLKVVLTIGNDGLDGGLQKLPFHRFDRPKLLPTQSGKMMETVQLPCATPRLWRASDADLAERRNGRCRSKAAGEKYVAASTQHRRTNGERPLSALPNFRESEQKAAATSGEDIVKIATGKRPESSGNGVGADGQGRRTAFF